MIHSDQDSVIENDTKEGHYCLLWSQPQKVRSCTLNTLSFLPVANYGTVKYKLT